ncbi:hypothetical protein BB8028_0008g00650 [Beauveria bassiana]|uniref:Uncharacterized protein n=1 Tax=Beauveria bassiana TaxID=176275 RepID=A0A2S7YMZ4_BEABA|nr:hypothetical protein BB8028_0008g00650 [Beauveria bassiana]
MAAKSAWRISQKVLVPLSSLMIIYAFFSVAGYHSPFRKNGQAKLFTTSRLPSEEHFLNYRKESAPVSIYHLLHVLPAVLWSIAMPLQHVETLRKKWPLAHRAAGYAILSLSLVLSMSGYWFFLSKTAYTHANVFHMHSLKGLGPILRWPTFELTLWVIAPFYWLTVYKTAVTARARNFAQHRKWAVLHTICASFISVERVTLSLLYGIGYALSFLPQEKVHEFFGVGHAVQDMAEAELGVFAFANTLSHAVILSWLAFECGRAGYLDSVKGYLSSRVNDAAVAKKVQ